VKQIVISASTVGAAGVAVGVLGVLGVGIASANTSAPPDVVGMTYSDAVSKIEDAGGTPKIQVTVGDRQAAMGDCLVTSATNAPFMEVSDGAFQHVDSVVLLALNCDRESRRPLRRAPRWAARRAGHSRPRRRKPPRLRSRTSKTYL
jgi:hypothetical protein